MHINKIHLTDFGSKVACGQEGSNNGLSVQLKPIHLEEFLMPYHRVAVLPQSCEEETMVEASLAGVEENVSVQEVNLEPISPFIDDEILRQNQVLETSLAQIKVKLAEIEQAQDARFSMLSQSILNFVKSIVEKIFKSPKLAMVVAETIVKHINQVLGRLSMQSKVNVMLPNNLSEGVKHNLVDMLKSAASKLNIEVIEHANDEIEVNWVEGKAEFQVEKSLAIIEEEVQKFTTSA
jgi:hypothetical protein